MKLKSTFITHNSGNEQLMISAGGDFNGMVRSNSTAGEIIDMMKKEITREEIIAAMLEKYADRADVTREELELCLADIAELKRLGKLFSADPYEGLARDYKNNSKVALYMG